MHHGTSNSNLSARFVTVTHRANAPPTLTHRPDRPASGRQLRTQSCHCAGKAFLSCTAPSNALETLQTEDVYASIARHESGDWGELCAEDVEANERRLTARRAALIPVKGPKGGEVLHHHRGRPLRNDRALARGLLTSHMRPTFNRPLF